VTGGGSDSGSGSGGGKKPSSSTLRRVRTIKQFRRTSPSGSGAPSRDTTPLPAGTAVGDYQIVEKVGEGGMGVVYSAIHPVIGKRAAVKVMNASLCADPVVVERFVREARAVNRIGHPNIVDIFTFGALPDGRSFLVMEWLAGKTLAERIEKGRVPSADAIEILLQVGEALDAAHEHAIVHRDLKPENIFIVEQRGRSMVKLLDFGIAKLLRPDGHAPATTQEGAWLGTPLYMSPEQARGQPVTHAADIYSLGVSAYELFTGKLPFVAESSLDVIHMHLYNVPPSPKEAWPDIPDALSELLLAMMEKDAMQRPPLSKVLATLHALRGSLPTGVGDAVWMSGTGSVRVPSPTPVPATAAAVPLAVTPLAVTPPAVTPLAVTPLPATPSGRRTTALVAVAVVAVAGVAFQFWPRQVAAPRIPVVAPPVVVAAPVAPPAAVAPVAPLPPGHIELTVNVPARIDIDGALASRAANHGTFSLPEGTHVLSVSAAKYRPYRKLITITPGVSTNLAVVLERATSGSSSDKQRKDLMDPFGR